MPKVLPQKKKCHSGKKGGSVEESKDRKMKHWEHLKPLGRIVKNKSKGIQSVRGAERRRRGKEKGQLFKMRLARTSSVCLHHALRREEQGEYTHVKKRGGKKRLKRGEMGKGNLKLAYLSKS